MIGMLLAAGLLTERSGASKVVKPCEISAVSSCTVCVYASVPISPPHCLHAVSTLTTKWKGQSALFPWMRSHLLYSCPSTSLHAPELWMVSTLRLMLLTCSSSCRSVCAANVLKLL